MRDMSLPSCYKECMSRRVSGLALLLVTAFLAVLAVGAHARAAGDEASAASLVHTRLPVGDTPAQPDGTAPSERGHGARISRRTLTTQTLTLTRLDTAAEPPTALELVPQEIVRFGTLPTAVAPAPPSAMRPPGRGPPTAPLLPSKGATM